MKSIEIEKQAFDDIIKTIIVPVITGIAFVLWVYYLIKSQPPPVLLFPLSSLILILLYFVSGYIYGGILLVMLTIVGFLSIFLAETLLSKGIFFLETAWLWSLFFLLQYYRMSLETFRNHNREEAETLDTRISLLESRIEEHKHRCANLIQRISNYQSLGRMVQALGSALKEDKIIPLIEELAAKIIGTGTWSVRKGSQSDVFAQYIKNQRLPLIIQNISTDGRFYVRHPHFCSLAAVPIEISEKYWGVIKGVSTQPNSFDEDDLRLLAVLSGIASLALNNAKLYQRTQELAVTDGLTGLYVQSYFKERLAEELLRSLSHHLPLSVAIIDIDFFKKINDTYGHAAGDVVLRQIAVLLRSRLRETDFVSRYGGEEFGVIMPQTDINEATKVARDLRASVEEERFFLPVESFHPVQIKLTISIGVTSLTGSIKETETLLANSDAALYRAKNLGRNRVEIG